MIELDFSSPHWRQQLDIIGRVLERDRELVAQRAREKRTSAAIFQVIDTTPRKATPIRPMGLARKWWGWGK